MKKITHEWFRSYYAKALLAKNVTLVEAVMLRMISDDADKDDMDLDDGEGCDAGENNSFLEFQSRNAGWWKKLKTSIHRHLLAIKKKLVSAWKWVKGKASKAIKHPAQAIKKSLGFVNKFISAPAKYIKEFFKV